MQSIIKLIIISISILVVGKITRLYQVDSFTTALIAAVLLAIMNTFIRPILIFITLPVTILTLGIFLIFINGLMLLLVSAIFPDFRVNGCLSAAIASILISIVSSVLEWIFI